MEINLKQRIITRRIIQILIVSCIFLMAITPIKNENDIFWQIRMGEEIVKYHHFPTHDHFSYTAEGAVWTLEEWVPGVIFYLIFENFGTVPLILLKAVVIALTFVLFLILFNKFKVNLYLSLFILFLAAMVNTRGVWVVFPSIFEYLFLVSTIFILEKTQKYSWKTIFSLCLLSFVWANSHGSFFIQSVIISSYIFGSFLARKLISKFPNYSPSGRVLDSEQSRKLSVALIFSLIAPFLTPNGYWTFLYPFRISLGHFTTYVSEYQKYWSIWHWNFSDFVHGFTFILISIIVVFFLFSIKKLNPIDLLLAVFFIGLALSAVRHVAIFALIALFLLAKYISVWFGEYRGWFRRSLIKDVLLILFLISFVFYYKTKVARFGFGMVEGDYPKEASEFVTNNKISGNMFNHYNYGGYLIWKMPQNKVFIDGRLEMYQGQLGADYQQIVQGGEGWKKLLEKYGVNFTLIYATDPVVDKLLGDSGWKLINVSGKYAVFVRDNAQNARLIATYWNQEVENALRLSFNSYAAEQFNDMGLEKIKRGELIRALDYFQTAVNYSPTYMTARFNLARGFLRLGWWNEAKVEYQEILKVDSESKEALDAVEKLKTFNQR